MGIHEPEGGQILKEIRSKRISKNGGLTIPSDIRREYNSFLGGEAVELSMEDGKLVITPHTPRCIFCFCNSVEDVRKFKGKYVCKECIAVMAEEAGISG
jgi:transcriptional pleiotropic regulator of transition state genes